MGRLWLLVFGVFLLSSGFVFCEEDATDAEEDQVDLNEVPEENDVLILSDSNFESVIAANAIVLVEFYAPWCGHCKSLAPEYEQAAAVLKENDPKVVLGKVDATVEKDVASQHGVSGYPTLVFYKNGAKVDYDGPRNSDGIVEYMKERADPAWKPPPEAVLTLGKSNFSEIVDSAELILVEFYAPWCSHCKTLAPVYEKAAKRLRHQSPSIPLAKVDASVELELAGIYDVKSYPALRVFKRGKSAKYRGGLDKNGKRNVMCGHCKQIAPELEKAAQQLKNSDPPISIAKVDATQESDLAREFEVTGYPTLKVFRRGKPYEYKGERKSYSIVSYMENERRPPSEELATLPDVKRYMKVDDITVLGFFKAKDAAFELYEAAANEVRQDIDLGHTFEREALNFYKVNAPSIAVFMAENFLTKYEQKYHVLPLKESTTVEEIRAFISEHSVPLVGEYRSSTKVKRYGGKFPLLLMFYSFDWSFDSIKATQLWRLKLADIAKDHRDITFAIANEDDHADLLKKFGFDDSGEEINIGVINEGQRKYPMSTFDSFDSDEVNEFIALYKAGKLSPKYRSQPVPKKSNAAVKSLVGSTFEKIVGDKSKDVVISIVAPKVPKCKKFAPKYSALAKQHAKTEKNLIFAKIDNSANELPDAFIVDGYPAIYMVPANGDITTPVKFSGDEAEVTSENLMEFVKENAKASFVGKDEL